MTNEISTLNLYAVWAAYGRLQRALVDSEAGCRVMIEIMGFIVQSATQNIDINVWAYLTHRQTASVTSRAE